MRREVTAQRQITCRYRVGGVPTPGAVGLEVADARPQAHPYLGKCSAHAPNEADSRLRVGAA